MHISFIRTLGTTAPTFGITCRSISLPHTGHFGGAFGSTGFAFEAALAECLRPAVRPLLVLLATEFRPCELIRSAVDGRFAARMVKPILDAQCRHLISRLFTGSRLA